MNEIVGTVLDEIVEQIKQEIEDQLELDFEEINLPLEDKQLRNEQFKLFIKYSNQLYQSLYHRLTFDQHYLYKQQLTSLFNLKFTKLYQANQQALNHSIQQNIFLFSNNLKAQLDYSSNHFEYFCYDFQNTFINQFSILLQQLNIKKISKQGKEEKENLISNELDNITREIFSNIIQKKNEIEEIQYKNQLQQALLIQEQEFQIYQDQQKLDDIINQNNIVIDKQIQLKQQQQKKILTYQQEKQQLEIKKKHLEEQEKKYQTFIDQKSKLIKEINKQNSDLEISNRQIQNEENKNIQNLEINITLLKAQDYSEYDQIIQDMKNKQEKIKKQISKLEKENSQILRFQNQDNPKIQELNQKLQNDKMNDKEKEIQDQTFEIMELKKQILDETYDIKIFDNKKLEFLDETDKLLFKYQMQLQKCKEIYHAILDINRIETECQQNSYEIQNQTSTNQRKNLEMQIENLKNILNETIRQVQKNKSQLKEFLQIYPLETRQQFINTIEGFKIKL